jgi:hypothetical protein
MVPIFHIEAPGITITFHHSNYIKSLIALRCKLRKNQYQGPAASLENPHLLTIYEYNKS